MRTYLRLALLFTLSCGLGSPTFAQPSAKTPEIARIGRYVAIDNVCAWPNLTVMPDGTIVATIFNKPSHGRMEGDVECWVSKEGAFWTRRGVAAPHEPMKNRMNVAAGLSSAGDLVVIASGWTLKRDQAGSLILGEVIAPCTSRSRDGETWTVTTQAIPPANEKQSQFIPFGDILAAEDGSLRATAYVADPPKSDQVSMLRSDDEGKTWKVLALISDEHNETAILHLGKGKWIAAARRGSKKPGAIDLFRSDDDGQHWKNSGQVGGPAQLPAHLLRLKDGRVLLTAGNRVKGQFGVVAQLSSDEGMTWSEPSPLVADLSSGDCGYPSSIQRPDGSIVTAYYAAGAPSHQRYHMGTLIWKLPIAAH
ncbi:sialidase family protein [Singulisphaera sp. Ch08]|uniref:Sialidase family protein n=1 Tax=Singulisphaera sp. Ch08 TaxID=3120278 RepID=A0AAU7C817_9BACT